MKRKVLEFGKNLSYVISSNLLSLLISILAVFILPKLIGIKEYGYWQLYQFYVSYVGFLHFGWNDGIYLRYGGQEYRKLDRELFFSQYYMLAASQILIGLIIFVIAKVYVKDIDRLFILWMICICLVLSNMRGMLLYIMQATNRIKEYARIIIVDRLIYLAIIVFLLIAGVRTYKLMIFSDLIGKLFSLIYATYYCREIVYRKYSTFCFSFTETISNISIGINLMIANIAGMMIVGVVKFGIERTWDVSTFGKVSLSLSVSNLLMVFVSAIGIILYPILKRVDENRLSNIYSVAKVLLMVVFYGILFIYYPLKSIMSIWLPQYAESLKYMALIFPLSIFEGKMAMLINTFLKTLRKEKQILKVNMITVGLSIILTIFTTYIMKNLDFAILSIVILLLIRSTIAENVLSKLLIIDIKVDIALEVALTIVFILSSWLINSWYSTVLYGIAYCGYLILNKEKIKISLTEMKQIIQ